MKISITICCLHLYPESWLYYLTAIKRKCVIHNVAETEMWHLVPLTERTCGPAVRSVASLPPPAVSPSGSASAFQPRSHHLQGGPWPMAEPNSGSQEHACTVASSPWLNTAGIQGPGHFHPTRRPSEGQAVLPSSHWAGRGFARLACRLTSSSA